MLVRGGLLLVVSIVFLGEGELGNSLGVSHCLGLRIFGLVVILFRTFETCIRKCSWLFIVIGDMARSGSKRDHPSFGVSGAQ